MEKTSAFSKIAYKAKTGLEAIDIGAIKDNAGKACNLMKDAADIAGTAIKR